MAADKVMIGVGDVVFATKRGGQDPNGLPRKVPEEGRLYRIAGIYAAPYGLGCTLRGMNPKPYKGFFLFVVKPARGMRGVSTGWYFAKVEKSTESVSEMLRKPVKEDA